MEILSNVFKNSQIIPRRYTCDGKNFSPPLRFLDISKNAKSLALIMDDPDAPVGLWVHWLIWNIAPNVNAINENQAPEKAVVGRNTSGTNKYTGPCPPDREHRYFFKLYALDITLDLPASADKNQLENAIQGHIIEEAELIGRYNRTNFT